MISSGFIFQDRGLEPTKDSNYQMLVKCMHSMLKFSMSEL